MVDPSACTARQQNRLQSAGPHSRNSLIKNCSNIYSFKSKLMIVAHKKNTVHSLSSCLCSVYMTLNTFPEQLHGPLHNRNLWPSYVYGLHTTIHTFPEQLYLSYSIAHLQTPVVNTSVHWPMASCQSNRNVDPSCEAEVHVTGLGDSPSPRELPLEIPPDLESLLEEEMSFLQASNPSVDSRV